MATSGQAKAREKKLAKMEIVETISEKPKPQFDFKFSRKPSRLIFEAKDLVIGYNEPLSSEINLKVESGQKIAFIGSNGIGKSTLLKSLMGLIPSLDGEVEKEISKRLLIMSKKSKIHRKRRFLMICGMNIKLESSGTPRSTCSCGPNG